jgi:tetratricopeptide (TPR) repeat protein
LVLFADSIKVAVDENKLMLRIGDEKLVWNSAPEEGNLSRPLETPIDFDNNSVYGLYLQGKNYINFKDYIKAEEKLNTCLQKDPNYAPALCEMASLQIREFQYTEAVNTTKKALSINTYDEAANYYYGLANLRLGNITDAKDGFDMAAAGVEFRSASYTELSKIYFLEKNMTKAIEYAEKSLVNNQYNLEGLQILSLIYRLQKNTVKANEVLNKINAIDPLNHFVRFEKYCLDGSEQAKEKFTSLIQNEMPQQTFLELGIWYYKLNSIEEANKIFSLAVPDAELLYWIAMLKNEAVDLSKIQTGTNFPFRSETATVLERSIKMNDQWMLKYHLGLIEWNRNNLSNAKMLFSQCGTQPNDPSFYAARAALMKDNPAIVEADLQHAVELDPKQWRYSKLLSEHFIIQKQYVKALNIAEPFYKSHHDNYIMGMLYAKTLLLNKKYAAADSFLTKLKILPFEGATIGRQLYHEAKLIQAVSEMKNKHYKKALQFIADAKLWPANLGVGRPYDEDIDERLEDWLIYQCNSNLGNTASAKQALQKILAFTPRVDNTIKNYLPANHLVSAWAIEKTSSVSKAEEWLQSQLDLFPGIKILQWTLQVYKKQNPGNLTEDEKDGEVRVLEQLLNK